MESAEILRQLSEIASDHFDEPGLTLTRETTADQVPGWDSMAHIQFLMQIERAFRIRFKSSEVSSFENVGQLADRIQSRMSS